MKIFKTKGGEKDDGYSVQRADFGTTVFNCAVVQGNVPKIEKHP